MNTLERRVERLEHRAKPKELRAVIEGLLTPLDPDDPRLRAGVDDEGEALVSPWWAVWFFEGTKEQQEARLKQLRADPEFQKKWEEDKIPVRFEGGRHKALCPFHREDTPSFTVFEDGFKCFGCDADGSNVDLLLRGGRGQIFYNSTILSERVSGINSLVSLNPSRRTR